MYIECKQCKGTGKVFYSLNDPCDEGSICDQCEGECEVEVDYLCGYCDLILSSEIDFCPQCNETVRAYIF